jgi:hypothetical protein
MPTARTTRAIAKRGAPKTHTFHDRVVAHARCPQAGDASEDAVKHDPEAAFESQPERPLADGSAAAGGPTSDEPRAARAAELTTEMAGALDDLHTLAADFAERAESTLRDARGLAEAETVRVEELLAENAHLEVGVATRNGTLQFFTERVLEQKAHERHLHARIHARTVENDAIRIRARNAARSAPKAEEASVGAHDSEEDDWAPAHRITVEVLSE